MPVEIFAFLPSGAEWLYIVILGLILFGPRKLPEIGRTLGKTMAEFRKARAELEREFQQAVRDAEKPTPSTDSSPETTPSLPQPAPHLSLPKKDPEDPAAPQGL